MPLTRFALTITDSFSAGSNQGPRSRWTTLHYQPKRQRPDAYIWYPKKTLVGGAFLCLLKITGLSNPLRQFKLLSRPYTVVREITKDTLKLLTAAKEKPSAENRVVFSMSYPSIPVYSPPHPVFKPADRDVERVSCSFKLWSPALSKSGSSSTFLVRSTL